MQVAPLPCILHWNQNHFVVLYKQKRGKKFYIADPGKGLVTYGRKEFMEHWVSTRSQGEEKGIAMFLQPTPLFYEQEGETHTGKRFCQLESMEISLEDYVYFTFNNQILRNKIYANE